MHVADFHRNVRLRTVRGCRLRYNSGGGSGHTAPNLRSATGAGGLMAATGCPANVIRLEFPMNISVSLAPIISMLAGILILVVPRMLNYIVAIYLICIGLIGLLGLIGAGNIRFN
jgi:hypothetical protein